MSKLEHDAAALVREIRYMIAHVAPADVPARVQVLCREYSTAVFMSALIAQMQKVSEARRALE